MQGLWFPTSCGENLPRAIVTDQELCRDLEKVYDEVSEQYDGDFEADGASDLGILLILAKRCYNDSRFEGQKEKIAILIQDLSIFVQSFLQSYAGLDLLLNPESDGNVILRDGLLTMKLALALGEEVIIITKDGDKPVHATFISFPHKKSAKYSRLWFTRGVEPQHADMMREFTCGGTLDKVTNV
ncbi:hypothetical protein UCRPC4_g05980 [Phaeomoniella chlamydospora]|uniref:Uncharacterized protein n=1 Tax=Phaeomoniella chlamydospora TaxID=158046 RepID=A0A0G2DZD3_PHACM|nr:hypothetical protein UCRPC4_g05980 [Phaeomoniella chlamydospora]